MELGLDVGSGFWILNPYSLGCTRLACTPTPTPTPNPKSIKLEMTSVLELFIDGKDIRNGGTEMVCTIACNGIAGLCVSVCVCSRLWYHLHYSLTRLCMYARVGGFVGG